MRIVRVADRAQAESARRCERVGQLRDREGGRRLRPGARRARGSSPRCRRSRVRGPSAARRRRRGCRSDRIAPPPARRVGDPHGPGPAPRDAAGAPVPLLAMARARAGNAGRPLGWLAVPPRRLAEPASPRRDDGHADQRRHTRRVRLVGRGALLPRRRDARDEDAVRADAVAERPGRQHLLRGRLRGDGLRAGGPLLRGAREAAGRRCVASTARARGEGRSSARPERERAARADRAAPGRRPLRRAAR